MEKRTSFLDRITCIGNRQSKSMSEDYEQVISEYKEKISSLRSDLEASKKESDHLRYVIKEKDTYIDGLQKDIAVRKGELEQVNRLLAEEQSRNKELNDENANLQEKNVLLVGKCAKTAKGFVQFVNMLDTMGFSSIAECIETVKTETNQSISELGFEFVNTYSGKFNSEIHCVVGTKTTDDSSLSEHIAEVVRPGVWYNNNCLIPMDVVIYTIE